MFEKLKHINLHLEHNPHKLAYETVEEYIKEEPNYWEWTSEEEKQKAIETDEMWNLHWYPRTPIGFNTATASTLEAILEYVNVSSSR